MQANQANNNDSGKNKRLTPEDRIDIAEYLAKGDELQEDCQRMGYPHENKKRAALFKSAARRSLSFFSPQT